MEKGYFAYMRKITLFVLCSSLAVSAASNHVGYRANASKRIVLPFRQAESLVVKDSQNQIIATLVPDTISTWDASGETMSIYDFSHLQKAGNYSLWFKDSLLNDSLRIREKPYHSLVDDALKFFYLQRTDIDIQSQYAGLYKRPKGHADTLVKLHSSTGDTGSIRSPKGWYDAGDFGKYIVNSGITMYTLLLLYEDYAKDFQKRTWNIPESGNKTPDLLDEIRYNLEWMLSMQAHDGGVYHKLTSLHHAKFVMPHEDSPERYAIGKSTSAALDFAAVMAMASRVYKSWDAKLAKSCLQASRKAFLWALAHPDIQFIQPPDVRTGQYGDSHLQDEFFWASVELAVADPAQREFYLAMAQGKMGPMDTPSWQMVGPLGYFTLARHPELGDLSLQAKDSLLQFADSLAQNGQSGYGVSLRKKDFVWGSNAVLSNQSLVVLQALRIQRKPAYQAVIQSNFDYLLGLNPLQRSYITGYGNQPPMHPHHRPSAMDSVVAPVPGMLAGGPHDGGQDEFNPEKPNETWKCPAYRKVGTPAFSFIDDRCSYATNEVAINWNAPLAYVAWALSKD